MDCGLGFWTSVSLHWRCEPPLGVLLAVSSCSTIAANGTLDEIDLIVSQRGLSIAVKCLNVKNVLIGCQKSHGTLPSAVSGADYFTF